MPALPDEREEQFCREVATNVRIVEAYTLAGLDTQGPGRGYRRIRPMALKLLQQAHIAERIKELRTDLGYLPPEQLEDDTPDLPLPDPSQNWTREQLVWQYQRIRRQPGHIGKAIRVLHLLGIANGLFKDALPTARDDFEHMTDEELHEAVRVQRARLDELDKARGIAGRTKTNGKANGHAGKAGLREEPGRVH